MDVPTIDIDDFVSHHAHGVWVLDVRMPDEYRQAHVPGAQLIPLPELAERADEVPIGGPVYVICAVGGRSARAAAFLREKGIDAINVAGGTNAWIEAGHRVVAGDDAQ